MNGLTALLAARLARARAGALPLVTRAAIGGLALGCAVLVVVLSVINGFERALIDRVLGVLPQLVVEAPRAGDGHALDRAQVAAVAGVVAVAPLRSASVLAAGTTGVQAATLYGVDPRFEGAVSFLGQFLPPPGFTALDAEGFPALIGTRLAHALGVAVGQRFTIVLPEATVTPLGVFPRQRAFRVAAIFESGAELDGSAIYVHEHAAARLLRDGAGSALRVRLANLFDAPIVGERIVRALGGGAARPHGVRVHDWTRTHGNLYRAIVVQKSIMLIVLSLVIAVAAFNVVSGLVMMVAEREADIAILRTLGLSSAGITRVFLLLGLVLGSVGITGGLLIGTTIALVAPGAFAWIESALGTDLLEEYFIRYLPSEVRAGDLLVVAAIALLLTAVAAVVPARRAAAIRPAEVLRYE